MPKAKRKNNDLPDLENHPYLSKKLVDIIYKEALVNKCVKSHQVAILSSKFVFSFIMPSTKVFPL